MKNQIFQIFITMSFKTILFKTLFMPMTFTACLPMSERVSAASSEFEPFRVSKNVAFSKPPAVLRQLIVSKGKNSRQNHFCVIGYHRKSEPAHEVFAWVYWQEEKAIILWAPSHPQQSLTRSRRYLRMPDDFVKTQDEIGGSTYLETYAWANDVIKDCMSKGDRYKF